MIFKINETEIFGYTHLYNRIKIKSKKACKMFIKQTYFKRVTHQKETLITKIVRMKNRAELSYTVKKKTLIGQE